MTTTVEVWERDHLTTPGVPTKVADLTEVWGRQFRVAKNDYGVATCNVQLSDPEQDEVRPGRLLVVNRDGTRYAFLIERRRIAKVKRGEEAEQVVALTCPGALAVGHDGRCQPQMDPGWQPWDRQRRWDWSSPDLSTSGWTAAVELWQQGTPGDPDDTSSTTFGILHDQGRFLATPPDGFVDGSAYWIWSSTYDGSAGTGDTGTLHMPVGVSFLHKTFTVASKTKARVIAGADDYLEVAVDGVVLFTSDPFPGNAHDRARQHDLILSAGTHTIRVRAANFNRGFTDGNIAGVVLTVHEVDEATNATGDVLVRTDNTWTALDYPDPEPGFTPGKILSTLLGEMQAEGFLLDVDLTCTDTLDSDSTAWDEVTDVVTRLGQSFADVLLLLAESHIDFRWNHDMTVDVWRKGEHGTATAVEYEPGVNITDLEFDGDSLPVSSLLIAHRDGVTVLGDDTVGRQEFVDLSSLPQAQALEQGAAMLAELSSERWAVTIGVEPVGSDVPLDDVTVLDTATVPNPSGTTSVAECIAVTWTEDEAGNELLTPEFGDLVLTPEERQGRQLARQSLGSLGGRVIVPPSPGQGVPSSPSGPGGGSFPPIAQGTPMVFEREADVTDTESHEWPASASGVIYEVGVQMDAQVGDTDVLLIVDGATVKTITVPAGKTTWPDGGLHVPVTKDQSIIQIGCADTGFFLQATVRIRA